MGERHPRPERGLISRPTCEEVAEYRAAVDRSLDDLLDRAHEATLTAVMPLLELGTNHEQQHQELLLMDIKHVFSRNPLRPAYRLGTTTTTRPDPVAASWIDVEPERISLVGHDGAGFAFDNEGPRHEVLVPPFAMADRLVTEGEWRAFVDDGGYRRSELWLSEGWAAVQAEGWSAPSYWDRDGDGWTVFTLGGTRPLHESTPVAHVSFFEADAFARWAGARLPTEEEWDCLLYTSPSPRDLSTSRMPSSA